MSYPTPQTFVEIEKLASGFVGRLHTWQIDAVIDYCAHNEAGLALQILADYVCDECVPISTSEFDRIVRLSGSIDEPISREALNDLSVLSTWVQE